MKDTIHNSLYSRYLENKNSDSEVDKTLNGLANPDNDETIKEQFHPYWEKLTESVSIQDSDLLQSRNEKDVLDSIHRRINQTEGKKRESGMLFTTIFNQFARIAAILIVPLTIYTIYISRDSGKRTASVEERAIWQTIGAHPGMQTRFELPDGTTVWLNAGSTLKFQIPFVKETRKTILLGEAFFDVKKDPDHPFVLDAGRLSIEVTGTRFNASNYSDDRFDELILEEGGVRLLDQENSNKVLANIKPGERASLDKQDKRLTIDNVDVSLHTSWKEGVLIFRDEKLEEVIKRINRWFNVEIRIDSPELKEYVYTATFKGETLHQILDLLCMSAPVEFSVSDQKKLNDNSFTKQIIILKKTSRL